jgi:hypothetical protein
MRELLEGVAAAGSWAVWMGVFSRSRMELLTAGGLSYKRARIVTGEITRWSYLHPKFGFKKHGNGIHPPICSYLNVILRLATMNG